MFSKSCLLFVSVYIVWSQRKPIPPIMSKVVSLDYFRLSFSIDKKSRLESFQTELFHFFKLEISSQILLVHQYELAPSLIYTHGLSIAELVSFKMTTVKLVSWQEHTSTHWLSGLLAHWSKEMSVLIKTTSFSSFANKLTRMQDHFREGNWCLLRWQLDWGRVPWNSYWISSTAKARQIQKIHRVQTS